MSGERRSLPRPSWLTAALFLLFTLGAFIVLRPFALQLVENRVWASALAGGAAGAVAGPVATFIVRSLFRQ